MTILTQTARRPMSYDTGTCEGWQASPSNPTIASPLVSGAKAVSGLNCTVVLRCTAAERAAVSATAKAAGVTVSALLRETLGLVRSRRRKPVPAVDPALIVAVARIGGNLNQIARQINRSAAANGNALDALAVVVRLVGIERQLAAIIGSNTLPSDGHAD